MLQQVAWERAPGFAIGSGGNLACKNISIQRGLAYHQKVYRTVGAWAAENADVGYSWVEEPWLRRTFPSKKMCQPDGVLIEQFTNSAIVIEAKLNWKDGRDEKLLATYLDAVKSAFDVTQTWPLLITKNVRGYKGEPLLGLKQIERVFEWEPGQLTPVMLLL
jgi:hypothetical protein